MSILYGYKGVLQVASLVLAFQVRKVKVMGLNDAKYIAGAVYVSSIILAVILLSTFSLIEYVSVYPAVICFGLLVGTTSILALIFVPKVSEGDDVDIDNYACIAALQTAPLAHMCLVYYRIH